MIFSKTVNLEKRKKKGKVQMLYVVGYELCVLFVHMQSNSKGRHTHTQHLFIAKCKYAKLGIDH